MESATEQFPEKVRLALARQVKNPNSKAAQKRDRVKQQGGNLEEFKRRQESGRLGGLHGKRSDKVKGGKIASRVKQLRVFYRTKLQDHPTAQRLLKELKELGWKMPPKFP